MIERSPLVGQLAAMRYISQTRHPALFMPMRCGKTLPTIRSIRDYTPRNPTLGIRALVIAPLSALPGWEDELSVEGVKRYILLTGTRTQRLAGLQSGAEWYLINPEGLRVIPEILQRSWMEWDAVVIDESTIIKNPKAQITQLLLKSFRKVPHRWILTGEPYPESLLDLWCQMAFLDRRPLGYSSYYGFRNKRFEESETGHDWQPSRGTDQLVVEYLASRAFVLSKEDAGLENREVYERRTMELPKKYRKIYETMEREYLIETEPSAVLPIDAVHGVYAGSPTINRGSDVLAQTSYAGKRWQWMQQLCGGFVQHELVWKGKIVELRYLLLGELAKEQVVVWFNYNQELHAVARNISAMGVSCKVFVGKTPKPLRGPLVHSFNRHEFRVLLVQQAVADMGVDLSGADTQIFYSNFPGLLRRKQCKARLEHPKRKKSFLTIDLCVKNTVNEDTARALVDKEWDSQAVMNRAIREMMQRRVA